MLPGAKQCVVDLVTSQQKYEVHAAVPVLSAKHRLRKVTELNRKSLG